VRSYIIFNYAIFFIDADGAVTLLNDNTRNNRNNIESSSTQLRERERRFQTPHQSKNNVENEENSEYVSYKINSSYCKILLKNIKVKVLKALTSFM